MFLSLPPSLPGSTPAEANCWFFFSILSQVGLFFLLPKPLSQREWGFILPTPECPASPCWNFSLLCTWWHLGWRWHCPVLVFINIFFKFEPPGWESPVSLWLGKQGSGVGVGRRAVMWKNFLLFFYQCCRWLSIAKLPFVLWIVLFCFVFC